MRTPIDALRSVGRYLADVLGYEWEVAFAVDEGTFRRPFCRVGFAGPAPMGGAAYLIDVTVPMTVYLWPQIGATAEDSLFLALAAEEVLTSAVRIQGGGMIPRPAAPTVEPLADAADGPGQHEYRVSALGWRGETAASPATLAAIGVRLTWDPVPGARGYRVYRDGRLLANVLDATYDDDGSGLTGTREAPLLDTARAAGPLRIPLYVYDNVPLAQSATVRGYADNLRVTDFTANRQVDPDDERQVIVVVDMRLAWRRTGAVADTSTTLQRVVVAPGG